VTEYGQVTGRGRNGQQDVRPRGVFCFSTSLASIGWGRHATKTLTRVVMQARTSKRNTLSAIKKELKANVVARNPAAQ
jgi:hypothetical protein